MRFAYATQNCVCLRQELRSGKVATRKSSATKFMAMSRAAACMYITMDVQVHSLLGAASGLVPGFSVCAAVADLYAPAKTCLLVQYFIRPSSLYVRPTRTLSGNKMQIWRRTTSTTIPCQASHVGNLESPSADIIGAFPRGSVLGSHKLWAILL